MALQKGRSQIILKSMDGVEGASAIDSSETSIEIKVGVIDTVEIKQEDRPTLMTNDPKNSA